MPTPEELKQKREAAKEVIDVLSEISFLLVNPSLPFTENPASALTEPRTPSSRARSSR